MTSTVMVLFCILVLSALCCGSWAITCDIKTQNFNKPEEEAGKQGFIEVNGVRAVSFEEVDTVDTTGLWVAAVTPACEIIDVTYFKPSVLFSNDDQTWPFMHGYFFMNYVGSFPLDTILIGASAGDVQDLFDRTICNTLTVSPGCIYERSIHTLAALGLQFHYTDNPSGDKTAGFVTQKGHPEKARWMMQPETFSPLGFETSISTPDVYACTPRQPIMSFSDTVTNYAIVLQKIQCHAEIHAWRFYAKSQGQVTFQVWRLRKNTDRFHVEEATTVNAIDMSVGDNTYCLQNPIEVEVGDYVGVHVTSNQADVIPRLQFDDIDERMYPNCKTASSYGLTAADLVPVYHVDLATNQNDGIAAIVFEDYLVSPTLTNLGAVAFHPVMAPDSEYKCSCGEDTDCTDWDRFASCSNGQCSCKTGFMLDYNTLTCIRENVALNKPVSVSELYSGFPSYAVDDNDAVGGTCTVVEEGDRPWLVVDLGQETAVHAVTLLPAYDLETINSASSAELYESTNCNGNSLSTTSDIPDLGDSAFNDITSCIQVTGPLVWKFYAESDYSGDSFTLTEGSYNNPTEDFGSVGDNAISSVAKYGLYPMKHVASGRCIDVDASRQAYLSSTCSRQWYFEKNFLTDLQTDQCLSVNQLSPGSPVMLTGCTTTYNFNDQVSKDALVLIITADMCITVDSSDRLVISYYINENDNCEQFQATQQNILKEVTSISADIDFQNSQHNDGASPWWATQGSAFAAFYHPPCVTYTTSRGNADSQTFITHVTDIDEDGIWFTIFSGSSWDDNHDFMVHYTVYEPPLFNFDISVGSSLGFEPGTYSTCTHYNGNAMGGERLYVPCDEPTTGRYLKIHLPGDGFTGQNGWAVLPLPQKRWFSLCDLDVHGLPAYSFGFPCLTDDDCRIPFTNQYLECQDNVCVCAAGFINHNSLDICIDIDECWDTNGGCAEKCVNTPGSYNCECPPYYELGTDKHTCYDIDECQPDNSGLPDCMALCGEPLCLDCSDWPCLSTPCRPPQFHKCSQLCANSPFPYTCSCWDGYYLARDNHTCFDVNECTSDPAVCDQVHGGCTNTLGSYFCYCEAGWQLDSDQKTCIDIDECLSDNGGCDHLCTDTDGSFMCDCFTGYDLLPDNRGCTDVNECMDNTDSCDAAHGICTNNVGSYTCSCETGWMLLDDNSCADIDECLSDNGSCDQLCTDTDGSFTCDCSTGYDLLPDNRGCTDVNECMDNTDSCDAAHGICTNNVGSYTCSCETGWWLQDDNSCADFNECTSDNGGCDQLCTDTEGSVICGCSTGYALLPDNRGCKDVDECVVGTHDCDRTHGVCSNTVGSYTCSCEAGWTILPNTNRACIELNECDPTDTPCEQGCTNTPQGAYTCLCQPGYYLSDNGFNCIDTDECASDVSLCDDDAVCVNTAGSYVCDCGNGRTLGEDGISCDGVLNPSGMSEGSVIGLSILGALFGLLLIGLTACLCVYCLRQATRTAPAPRDYVDTVEYVASDYPKAPAYSSYASHPGQYYWKPQYIDY